VRGRHAISARLDDGDLYVGLGGGCRRSLLCEEGDGCSSVDEGGMIKLYWIGAAGFTKGTSSS
jgi:hypothetical protein